MILWSKTNHYYLISPHCILNVRDVALAMCKQAVPLQSCVHYTKSITKSLNDIHLQKGIINISLATLYFHVRALHQLPKQLYFGDTKHTIKDWHSETLYFQPCKYCT